MTKSIPYPPANPPKGARIPVAIFRDPKGFLNLHEVCKRLGATPNEIEHIRKGENKVFFGGPDIKGHGAFLIVADRDAIFVRAECPELEPHGSSEVGPDYFE